MKTHVRIGNVDLGTEPRIVAVVGGSHDDCVAQAGRAVQHGADLAEVRVDLCYDSPVPVESTVDAVRKASCGALPLILTIRTFMHGGEFVGSESARLKLFERLIALFDAVDVELEGSCIRNSVLELARQNDKAIIVSYHNRERTPPVYGDWRGEGLADIMAQAVELRPDVLKIVVAAQRIEDVKVLTCFTAHHSSEMNLVTISGGVLGAVSRIVNPLVGACMTYGDVGAKAFIPGILPVTELRGILSLYAHSQQLTEDAAIELVKAAWPHDSAVGTACSPGED